MTVSSRKVSIGRTVPGTDRDYRWTGRGEEIVAVGAPYLAEGMRVTRMAEAEQAMPRADDPS